MSPEQFKFLRLYNESVKLYNNHNISYSARCLIKDSVVKYSKDCARLGVYD